MMRILVEKLQKGLSLLFLLARRELEVANLMAPKDVKKGHFVVFSGKGDETQKFVVELCFLKNPEFLCLLELAEEEYGFEQKALTLPCRPQELQKILESY